jgi:hypothetical protein
LFEAGQETLAIMKIAVSVLKVLVPIWVTKISTTRSAFESVETAEIKIEVTFEKHLESKILKALLAIMFMKRWPTKFMNYKTRIKIIRNGGRI